MNPVRLAILLVLVAASVAACGGSGDSGGASETAAVEETLVTYFEALRDRDVETACSLFSGDFRRMVFEAEDLTCSAALRLGFTEIAGDDMARLLERIDSGEMETTIIGNQATATFPDDEGSVVLIEVGGDWYIDSTD